MNPFKRVTSQRVPLRAEAPSPRGDSSGVTLRLYDPVDSWGGEWGVSAKEFTATLDELPDDTAQIKLLVNSPGGDVWEGLAILNALRAHPAHVVAVVEGIAASAASFIVAGVDELQVMPNAELMVHKAWGMGLGNADDFTKLSADLTHEDRNIASVYAAKAGGTVEDWLAAMSAETWYSAEEAVAAGLADKVLAPPSKDKGDAKAKARARFDFSAFAHSSRAEAPEPFIPNNSPAQTPAAAPADGTKETPKEGSTTVASFSDESTATLRQKLGIADGADEATILAALDEALDERSEPQNTISLPDGVVAIDAAQLSELRNAAELGRQAHERQERDGREALVNQAVQDGRIAPARREAWLNRLAADPAESETLNQLEKGLVPVVELGRGGGAHDDSTLDRPINDAEAAELAVLTGVSKEMFLRG